MIRSDESNCPDCGGFLKYYDRVKRMFKVKGGYKKHLKIRRLRCVDCKRLHRELPAFILPYKHYEVEIINGVLNGYITSETIGFEDYPCEMTMGRWTRKNHFVL